MTYQVGNTVRFQATFRDFNDLIANPTDVVLTVYDEASEVLYTSPGAMVSTGVYEAYYVPAKSGNFTYEWKATLNEKPFLTLKPFPVVRGAEQ